MRCQSRRLAPSPPGVVINLAHRTCAGPDDALTEITEAHGVSSWVCIQMLPLLQDDIIRSGAATSSTAVPPAERISDAPMGHRMAQIGVRSREARGPCTVHDAAH